MYHTIEHDAELIINGHRFFFPVTICGRVDRDGRCDDVCFEDDIKLSEIVENDQLEEKFGLELVTDCHIMQSDRLFEEYRDRQIMGD